MAHTAACSSCGAPVEFRSAASILAVCEYCQSTLLRQGEVLENLGKMAELLADNSPLQLGSEGKWQGRHFALVGRIQLRYAAGVWNEWYLLFDDGRAGWLSEASGEYVISFLKWVPDPIPPFSAVTAGEALTLDGTAYTVSNVEQAECVAGAGELPFKVGAGYPAPVVDLRAGAKFATIDFSDGKPMVFFGQAAPFAGFQWANLRENVPLPGIDTKAEALSCPSCGAAISLHADAIKTVACQHCGSVSDLNAGKLELWSRAAGVLREAPWLPLGSRGTLRGEAVEVIGAMVRATTSDGTTYAWREYLLLTAKRDFVWLTEYDGHWNLLRTLSAPPAAKPGAVLADVMFEGRRYQHFTKSKAEVDYVIGEFNWQVRVGEATEVDDYICPPHTLSREWSAKELVWSHGEYLEPEEVVAAFKVAAPPPARIGVGACQPSPTKDRHAVVCKRFWQFAALAIVIQVLSVIVFGQKELLRQPVTLNPNDDEPVVTREFRLTAAANKLTVRHSTNVSDSWAGLGMTLVEKNSGKAWAESREVSYYSGVDSDGSWSEGSREDAIVFRDLPPGTYVLAIDPDLPADKRETVQDTVEIVAGERVWSNLAFVLVFLAVFPVITRWRQAAFEIRRWADSDHPKIASSDDDD